MWKLGRDTPRWQDNIETYLQGTGESEWIHFTLLRTEYRPKRRVLVQMVTKCRVPSKVGDFLIDSWKLISNKDSWFDISWQNRMWLHAHVIIPTKTNSYHRKNRLIQLGPYLCYAYPQFDCSTTGCRLSSLYRFLHFSEGKTWTLSWNEPQSLLHPVSYLGRQWIMFMIETLCYITHESTIFETMESIKSIRWTIIIGPRSLLSKVKTLFI
jgi:hypothetical protein